MIVVVRCGHRSRRDERVTTHVCLVARAFGAERIIIEGSRDNAVLKVVQDVVERWGGTFKIDFTSSWKKTIKELKQKKFVIVHLTMYGVPINDIESKIKKHRKIAVVVGSQKVSPELYNISDYNISITNQPHSEIAALAVFLDRYFGGKEIKKRFKNAKIEIVPQKKGKKVVKKEKE